nr:MAG TPA: hypothetical protein [Caudoviricetes sp.]
MEKKYLTERKESSVRQSLILLLHTIVYLDILLNQNLLICMYKL